MTTNSADVRYFTTPYGETVSPGEIFSDATSCFETTDANGAYTPYQCVVLENGEVINIIPIKELGSVALAAASIQRGQTTRDAYRLYVGRDWKEYYARVREERQQSLVLSEEEFCEFKHSDTFCAEHSISGC